LRVMTRAARFRSCGGVFRPRDRYCIRVRND
jgi:hypothetical protein